MIVSLRVLVCPQQQVMAIDGCSSERSPPTFHEGWNSLQGRADTAHCWMLFSIAMGGIGGG